MSERYSDLLSPDPSLSLSHTIAVHSLPPSSSSSSSSTSTSTSASASASLSSSLSTPIVPHSESLMANDYQEAQDSAALYRATARSSAPSSSSSSSSSPSYFSSLRSSLSSFFFSLGLLSLSRSLSPHQPLASHDDQQHDPDDPSSPSASSRFPYRTAAAALLLLLSGVVFLSLGIYRLSRGEGSSFAFFLLGTLLVIPGAYQTYMIVQAWRRRPGFSFAMVANYEQQ